MGKLVFYSTAALERGLDGHDETFVPYFFAMYHCSPDEDAGVNQLRDRLSQQFPEKVTRVGKRFVLSGHPAAVTLTSYFQALSEGETLGEDFRRYAAERVRDITDAHRESQSLPIPIDLTEGQLANDGRLELLTCIALRNGQVVEQ